MTAPPILLHHKAYGEQGSPLLVLHGLFGSLDNWHTLATRWSSDFRVFPLDQRNHGKSPHAEAMDYPTMAADVAYWMEVQGLAEAFVIGHSMGGKTAMQLAHHYPERVRALMVADIAPKAYPAGHDFILSTLREFPVGEIASRKEAEQWMAERIGDPGIRLFLLKNLARDTQRGGYRWKMHLPAIERNYERILEGIAFTQGFDKPTLFARGERSGYVRDEDRPLIEEGFTNVHFVTFPDTGHWLHAENPELFYQTVIDFFKPLEP
jgi:pimeloyl-ACP methyl ester carboxylesterase